ncbi:NAD-glutamate dehydrogenase domain-containing protein [Modestobacter caceresii]|uniref:NAD-glutamate dehydrogenase domain-containing protein n=1 Tax=Modestobacter caceresii TaxID=1522368 RepID=UPI00068B5F29|nr:NAD-glutamate dehydrogenase domain-containing protein [Modestobacter caceresii]
MGAPTAVRPDGRVTLRPAPDGAADHGRLSVVATWPAGRPLLADVVPVFERLGVRVADAVALPEVALPGVALPAPPDDDGTAPYRLELLLPPGVDATTALPALDAVLAAAWAGETELDGLSRLTVTAGLSVADVTVLRAACRFLAQTGLGLSRGYVERTVLAAPDLARALVHHFTARHDPDRVDPVVAERVAGEIEDLLARTTTLDEDRILRGLHLVLSAVLRTNAFRTDATGRPWRQLTLKIDSQQLPFLPAPRPWVETFVCSPTMEGLHLRGAPVARGGIRWSERPDDFRTEVLGLFKAQQVKNAVIVPAGAKGAFVLREDVRDLDREALREKVSAAYRTFVEGLLDVTDDLVDGAVVHPDRTVVHDGPDSYLVVAADKGTATFSDLANAAAVERGHWLGDAFASGGSTGYDHKAMGITARGAWVPVRRHLRELGTDVDTDPVTVVGIGDMSGDVFGNGMLLSPQLRLVAAFDHRHVFLDPDPDPDAALAERRRLADLPTSSWADYDPAAISTGGGVHRRDAKSVPLSAQVQRRLGVSATELSPAELIRAVLRAPVDLLWNGGIGTYVRADDETDAEVGDRANDPVRVTAGELRCRIVGEGGNLGLTQRARVAAARAGVRVNTDFIDNSAGVDTSDREVNLKVLLGGPVADGELTVAERDELLRAMTDEVAVAVLADSALQARALSVCADQAPFLLDRHAGLIRDLERQSSLDRRLEHLPSEAEVDRLRQAGGGLTRPEAAVLLAYSKNLVRAELLASSLPDDPALGTVLLGYFPQAVRERWPDRIAAHPLAREITATQLANDLVNRVGPGFLHRLEERHGVGTPIGARAFAAAAQVLGLDPLWALVDDDVPLAVERLALPELQRAVEHAADRLLRRFPEPAQLTAAAPRLAGLVGQLGTDGWLARPGLDANRARRLHADLLAAGAGAELAAGIAALGCLTDVLELGELAEETGIPIAAVVDAHVEFGEALGLPAARAGAGDAPTDSHWVLAAKAALRDELDTHRLTLTRALMRTAAGDVAGLLRRHGAAAARFSGARDAASAARDDVVAVLAVLTAELHRLAQAVARG